MRSPYERTNAVLAAERVPREIRKRAAAVLRHFQRPFDMRRPAQAFESLKRGDPE